MQKPPATPNLNRISTPSAETPNTALEPVVGGGKPLASLKKGGTIPKTGLYRLHRGERVIPKQTVDILMGKAKPTGKVKVKNLKGKK